MMKKYLEFLKRQIKTLGDLIYRRDYIATKLEKEVLDRFHKLYYDSQTWGNTFWLGIQTLKCPLDLWIYQEIIFEQKPDIIIECGTANGGSALFLASICDLVNNGEIITIDIENKQNRPQHERIKYLVGSSTSEKIVDQIRKLISDKNRVMAILDSDHHKEHVLNELTIYSKFVTKGSYIIVEDTNEDFEYPLLFPSFIKITSSKQGKVYNKIAG